MEKIDTRYNKNNEIVKYEYFEEIHNCKDGKSPETIRKIADALHQFEIATNFKDFMQYNKSHALTFKDHLNNKKNAKTGENISKSYYFHNLLHVRTFFEWLKVNKQQFYKIKFSNIDYLHPTRKEASQAKVSNPPESHCVKDVLQTIRNMPDTSEIEMRDKALLSLLMLTSPRTNSIKDARLGKIKYYEEYESWAFIQDPRTQNTKFSKHIISFFVGQSQDIIDNVLKWKGHLEAKGFKESDYLFPKVHAPFTKTGSNVLVISKEKIRSESKIRDIVKKAFQSNDLKYINPHNFRHTIAKYVRKNSTNPVNEFISLSENFGHEAKHSTLISSYACDPLEERAKLIKAIKLE